MSTDNSDGWYCLVAGKKIAGVCAGVASYYQQPKWLIRLIAIVLLLSFPTVMLLAYLVAALVLPSR